MQPHLLFSRVYVTIYCNCNAQYIILYMFFAHYKKLLKNFHFGTWFDTLHALPEESSRGMPRLRTRTGNYLSSPPSTTPTPPPSAPLSTFDDHCRSNLFFILVSFVHCKIVIFDCLILPVEFHCILCVG